MKTIDLLEDLKDELDESSVLSTNDIDDYVIGSLSLLKSLKKDLFNDIQIIKNQLSLFINLE
ncbi:hypothetical protein ANSO36C_66880 (plasmid) [Nostoc cf. commune SO-36]|uniref:Uncharacterized protein n=1 Tax=Nostoc cf. commune SO-36 TaxID=449208 RepID=A0ABM7ZC53_NOSCO|nr:hypothetical protein [Nostoc commune]BDI20886.1 hypothetical protein ANSO36C_66880 [Nostoc cf. commune SO-36]